MWKLNVIEFRKINHFVTFDTSNIYVWNIASHSRNPHYSELSFTLYNELPEFLGNILIAVCILLWQQGKVLGSTYFIRDKVVDFPKSGHKYCGNMRLDFQQQVFHQHPTLLQEISIQNSIMLKVLPVSIIQCDVSLPCTFKSSSNANGVMFIYVCMLQIWHWNLSAFNFSR